MFHFDFNFGLLLSKLPFCRFGVNLGEGEGHFHAKCKNSSPSVQLDERVTGI